MRGLKKVVIFFFLVVIVIWISGRVSADWSKKIRIGVISHRPQPVQVIEYNNLILGGYVNHDEKIYHLFKVKKNSAISNEDFGTWVDYHYMSDDVYNFNLTKVGGNPALFWISHKDNYYQVNVAVFEENGKRMLEYSLFNTDDMIKDLYVYAMGSEVYLTWVRKKDQEYLLCQKLVYEGGNFFVGENWEIARSKVISLPQVIKDGHNKLHFIWKTGVWKGGEGLTYDILYATIGKTGEVSEPILFGHSINSLLESRHYDELDTGPRLIYDSTNDQVIGAWTTGDYLVRLTFTAPGFGPNVSILRGDQFVIKDQPILSLKSLGQFPDVANNNEGECYIVWSDDFFGGKSQIFFGNLLELYNFNKESIQVGKSIVDNPGEVSLQIPSSSKYGAWYPRLLIDNTDKVHLFWWETIHQGYKLIYRNNQDIIPYEKLSHLGLNPEADDFSWAKASVEVIFAIFSSLIFGGVYTFLNILNVVAVIVVIGFLKKWGFYRVFKRYPKVLLPGLILMIFLFQSPKNIFYISLNPDHQMYFLGGILATLMTVSYWLVSKRDINDSLEMLGFLLLWSYWQHLVLVFPVVGQWLG